MLGPIFTEEQAEEIRRKYGIRRRLKKPFHKVATDADLGRKDRRLALVEELPCGCNECDWCVAREENGYE